MKIKTLFVLISLTTFSKVALCQSTGIEIVNDRFVFLNVSNSVQVFVEGTDCDSILIKSDANVWREKDCFWVVKPDQFFGRFGLKIEIFKLKNVDTIHIETKRLKVKTLKTMAPHIGQFFGLDTIGLDEMKAQMAISAFNSEWDKTGSYVGIVKSFNCLALRNNQILGFQSNRGAKFNNRLKNYLAN